MDINNIILNDDLQEEVHMSQPFGFENGNKNVVCELYGVKCSKSDSSMFIKTSQKFCMLIMVYVLIIPSSAFQISQNKIKLRVVRESKCKIVRKLPCTRSV